MINNWARHNLNMDFSNIQVPRGKPSDLDMFYIGYGYLIVGEIKNIDGTFTDNQKRMYEGFVNGSQYKKAIAIYINHNKRIENGDANVDVANCYVTEYYIKGNKGWLKPKKPTSVQDIFDYCEEEWRKK